jgi:imidazolonepropionase-like amidohydrolase
MKRPARLVLTAAALLVGTGVLSAQLERKVRPRPIVIVGGTLVDGAGGPARHNDAIVIEDGVIKTIGLGALRRSPKDARQLDATGKWIIPGLVDGHVHLFQSGGLDARPDLVTVPGQRPYAEIVEGIRRNPAPYLRAYVCSGVTSVIDLGGPEWTFDVRDSREDDALAPRIAPTGPFLATRVPPALQVRDGEPFWPMVDATGVAQQVRRLATRKPAAVAILWSPASPGDVESGAVLIKAAIDAAHAARLRAVVHAPTLQAARRAIEAGADVLANGIPDAEVDDAFVALAVQRGVICISTLVAAQDEREVVERRVRFEPIERRCVTEAAIEAFSTLDRLPAEAVSRSPLSPSDSVSREARNLVRLVRAGASFIAGTGAGDVRTLHGPSLHREFALMAEAGLTPMQILVSATKNAARLTGREREVGQIKPGMLADMVLLDADPLADIRNTRRIATVIRGGTIYER